MNKSHLNFAIVLYATMVATVAALRSESTRDRYNFCLLLTFLTWTVILSHRQELLRFRWAWLTIYTGMAVAGFVVTWLCPAPSGATALAFLFSGLAVAPVLLPGAVRLLLYYIRCCVGARSAGGLEAISLLTTFAPGQIERLRDATRHSLANRSWRQSMRNILNGELMIATLVAIVAMMHLLAAAAIHRRFIANSYAPRFNLSLIEQIVYLLVPTILLVL